MDFDKLDKIIDKWIALRLPMRQFMFNDEPQHKEWVDFFHSLSANAITTVKLFDTRVKKDSVDIVNYRGFIIHLICTDDL
jgi:hypothetical protein